MSKQEPQGFPEFWALWLPKKRHTDGRGDARTCFAKHLKAGVDPQDIIDGARWFLRNLKDPQYIPLAATWLNRCDYEDGCIAERSYQARQASRETGNVTPIRRAPLPENHFLNQWKKQG